MVRANNKRRIQSEVWSSRFTDGTSKSLVSHQLVHETKRDKDWLDNESKWRNMFERDRDRILHCEYFRRLQGKTQVFGAFWSPHLFSRVTHSLQVAQVARAIARKLQYQESDVFPDIRDLEPIVEAVGLAHDIGHPPFGHFGETALNSWLLKTSNRRVAFEGNAQTFRILTRLERRSAVDSKIDKHSIGLNLTRASLLGIVKYPKPRFKNNTVSKFNFYADDDHYVRWLYDLPEFTISNSQGLISVNHDRYSDSRSIECKIMDWADDIANSAHDLEDAYLANFILRNFDVDARSHEIFELIQSSYGETSEVYTNDPDGYKKLASNAAEIKKHVTHFHTKLQKTGRLSREAPHRCLSNEYITRFITKLEFSSGTSTTYPFGLSLRLPPEELLVLNVLKSGIRLYVHQDYRLRTLSHKVIKIISDLADAFYQNCDDQDGYLFRLFPRHWRESLEQTKMFEGTEKQDALLRVISDFIATLTEREAISLHNRLFSAEQITWPDFL